LPVPDQRDTFEIEWIACRLWIASLFNP
jgi:hypothetical protein